jgi:hypothetical protein
MSEPSSSKSKPPIGIPEEALEEPRTLSPAEDAERAARRLERDENDPHTHWPTPDDPLRQGGELSAAPYRRT